MEWNEKWGLGIADRNAVGMGFQLFQKECERANKITDIGAVRSGFSYRTFEASHGLRSALFIFETCFTFARRFDTVPKR